MTVTNRLELAPEYGRLWDQCVPAQAAPGAPARDLNVAISSSINLILAGKPRYQTVELETGVPWWFTGILHMMECSGSWKCHLHNGDPLTARTVQVPAGRPEGDPPFTWEESAEDALTLKGWGPDKVARISGVPDWSLPTVLWRFEYWNGFGYRTRGIRTPYLWASSNLEQPGRYIKDGVWDAGKWSSQIGAAVLLKTMVNRGLVAL